MGFHLNRQAASTTARGSSLARYTFPLKVAPRSAGADGPDRWTPQWTKTDLICMCVGFLLTLGLAAAMGHRRIFWEDELLGWLMLRDPSWKHMITGWLHGVDGGGILFYLTGRLWFLLFGPSVLSFRMYSATGFATAFVTIWMAARRYYSPRVVAFAILVTWFGSPVLVQALCSGRFYGLLMASDAFAVYLYFRLAEAPEVPRRFYLFVMAAHACLLMSHILGFFYSSLIVLAMVLMDLIKRRWRPRLYLAAMVPALLLIPCLPAIYASALVGKPHFWSAQPTFVLFLSDFTGFSLKLGILLLLTIAFLLIAFQITRLRSAIVKAAKARTPAFVYTGAIFLLPFLFLAAGVAGPALCIPRYLLPVSVGTIFLIAEIMSLLGAMLLQRSQVSAKLWAAPWTAFLAILLLYDFFYLPRYNSGLQKDYTGALTAQLPKGTPVICEDAFAFTELISLQHGSGVLYTFLLDWKTAVASMAPRVEVTQYHLMENWKRHGFFSGSILNRDQFLQTTPAFYSVSFTDFVQPNPLRPALEIERYPGIGDPLHLQLTNSKDYKVSLYKRVPLPDLTASIWRICRRGAPQCQ